MYRHEVDLELVDPADDGTLRPAISSAGATSQFELTLFENDGSPDHTVKATDATKASITYRGRSRALAEFFDEEAPTFWFADGSSLTGAEYVALRRQPEAFPRTRIESWDWSGHEDPR